MQFMKKLYIGNYFLFFFAFGSAKYRLGLF